MDLETGVWMITGDRMKAGRSHRVPLSPRAMKLLKALPRLDRNPHVFPGSSKLGRLSENTLNEVLKRLHERAYARDDALEQRRTIMVAWSEFVSKPDKAGQVRCASR